ncbi:uroporphyrinogen-III synthase [Grimontia hollisae]|uniref:Uroporphyrinogen-III synthase n=1 Tax=Grimontia hollisae TaxID=673 RepID=A0A377HQM8_GRIHO|nr:uroporphyrinogen-III synthase [Grimontia hollisae]MDF2184827.1 uroporphyrinogen-III synthase [Grimontia hollisae]STO58497.1 uroporphyrinogen-III synthase [Grimontia hollisae]STQ74455.1 uroporphyrinogen-III synthase [Grimontia hollisae]
MTVLVVRPAPACYELVETLNQSGIKALPAPLLSFSEGKDLPVLTNTYRRLPSGSVVVAVSPRAIEYTQQQFRNDNTAWRDDLHYVAVGEKTAQVWLEESGINALQPPTEDSEGMLSLSVFGEPEHLEVLILRGNGGRALLGNTLASRGAKVHYFEAYQRHWTSDSLLSLAMQWQAENVDTLVVTSGEQLSLLCQTISESNQQWLRECHILVPSKRIYNQAIGLGFNTIRCVNSASNTALFHALNEMINSGHSDDRQE